MATTNKNTTPEAFDESVDYESSGNAASMDQEDILMNESDILDGLLKAGAGIDDKENYRKIRIQRRGKLLFEFRVRPVTEEETRICTKRATPTARKQHVKPETDWSKFRSCLIYTATVDEDRAKVWDNKKAQESFGIFQGVDMIDRVLFAGEKSNVIDVIEEISDVDESWENTAKNS